VVCAIRWSAPSDGTTIDTIAEAVRPRHPDRLWQFEGGIWLTAPIAGVGIIRWTVGRLVCVGAVVRPTRHLVAGSDKQAGDKRAGSPDARGCKSGPV
jgi:hypothetical protein